MWNFVKPDTHFFNAEQRQQVEALFEAILPGSETSPGATDANAAEYLDTLLTMDEETLYLIPQLRTLYPVGLLATEDAARRAFGGRGIAALTLDERTLLLQKLSEGKLEGTSFSAKDRQRFFTDLRTRCIEGCFGDARWGEGFLYSDLSTDMADLYPELAVGRLPVTTATDVQVMLAKLRAYTEPAVLDYQHKISFLAEVLWPSNYSTGAPILKNGADNAERIILQNNLGSGAYALTRLYETPQWYPGSARLTRSCVNGPPL